MRRLPMALIRYTVPCVVLAGLTACGFSFGKPNAQIETNDVTITVHNLDKNAWTDCHFILNANSGSDHQYDFNAGDIAGLADKTVMLPQFTNKDGKRFIPVLTKVLDVKVQCQSPLLPFSQTVSQ